MEWIELLLGACARREVLRRRRRSRQMKECAELRLTASQWTFRRWQTDQKPVAGTGTSDWYQFLVSMSSPLDRLCCWRHNISPNMTQHDQQPFNFTPVTSWRLGIRPISTFRVFYRCRCAGFFKVNVQLILWIHLRPNRFHPCSPFFGRQLSIPTNWMRCWSVTMVFAKTRWASCFGISCNTVDIQQNLRYF